MEPLIYADYPDPDVIRVGKKYYMITTTMHVFPGGDLLVSEDLLHWELCCHVFDALDHTPAQKLESGHIYGKGMWAASLRHHEGLFHILFVCNDTGLSYHYTAERPEGPWARHAVEGFYHDASILFDDDGRVYLAYGNTEIHIQEMKPDLSAPLPGGLHRVAVRDEGNVILGYEGAHFYKLNGRYYLFLIHWPKDEPARRTQACFTASSLTEPFTGGDILREDGGFFNQGIAQGGIVDTPEGEWYSLLFQDRGAVGRVPVLLKMDWENGLPASLNPVTPPKTKPPVPASLVSSDPLTGDYLQPFWQWNHQPDESMFSLGGEGLVLRAGFAPEGLEFARNTLTQRTFGPRCAFEVTLDLSKLTPGDKAGLCALQGCYAALGAEMTENGLQLVFTQRKRGGQPCQMPLMPLSSSTLQLRACFDFTSLKDRVQFFFRCGDRWIPAGEEHSLHYMLDHFMGCRIGLYCYSQKDASRGCAVFRNFLCEA